MSFFYILKKCLKIFLITLFIGTLNSNLLAQDIITITLANAQEMAVKQNHLLKISREHVIENEQKVKESQSQKYPALRATGTYVYNGIAKDLNLPKGSLGNFQNSRIVVPQNDITILDNKHSLYSLGIVALQPITQQGKISAGVKVAKTDVEIAKTQASKAEQQIRQAVEKLYYGILIAQKRKDEAELNVELSKARVYDIESALMAGKTDSTSLFGMEAELAGNEQRLLEVDIELEDYLSNLSNFLGIRRGTRIAVKEPVESLPQPLGIQEYLETANQHNYDLKIAGKTKQKAQFGLEAAKKDFLPDLSAVAGLVNQSIVSVLPSQNYFLGFQMNWNFFDFGRKKSVFNQRLSQQKQAEENILYVKDTLVSGIEKAYRKIRQTLSLINTAQKVINYRQKAYKLQNDKLDAGFILKKELLETKVALVGAQADLFAAKLAYRAAVMELEILTQ